MADYANFSSFKTQETHLGGITKQNHCPCFCASRDYSCIIENKCYKLSTLWSLFLVCGPSVCSDFFLLIGSDWLQLGNLNPDHTGSLLEERMARALPLRVSNFIYCLGFFFSMNFNFSYQRPLDCKEIQLVHSKGDQSWDFFGRNDAKAEAPVLWPPHAKS